MKLKKALPALAVASMMTASMFAPAHADLLDYFKSGNDYYNDSNNSRIGSFMYDHPYMGKAAAVGVAGAAVGALMSDDGNRGGGAVKGAIVGAGLGLGYEYLRQKGHLPW